jgi:hypothetical protein
MIDNEQRQEIVRQIGRMNLMAISGGRVIAMSNGIRLPDSRTAYSVVVVLEANDTYTVKREFCRKVKGIETIYPKGERTNVYCDELGEVAYYASCFVSYDETEWMYKA